MKLKLSLSIFSIFLFFSGVFAQVPDIISYQGILKNTDGSLVSDGTYSITFKIYESETGSTEIWSEIQSVSISDGLVNVNLGDVAALNISFDTQYWLGITIAGGTELSPRTKLTSVPYSLNAKNISDSTVTTAKIADEAVTTAKISTSGASSGQALIYDGSSVTWGNPSGASFTLPYSDNISSSSAAFSISNTGAGNAAYFGGKVTATDVIESTSGGFKFPDGTTQTSSGITLPFSATSDYSGSDVIFIKNSASSGKVADFEIFNSGNSDEALYVSTTGSGKAIYGKCSGTGIAGYFLNSYTENSNSVLFAQTNGLGTAGYFYTYNSSNSNPTIYAYNRGTGAAGYSYINNSSSSSNAVYAYTNGTGNAGEFDGDVQINGDLDVTGTVSKGGGTFAIDHPLDPENKILRHSFVESPEMMNIYKGRAKLVNGKAVIELPEYFDALNHQEGRVLNLTCINGWSPLFREGEIRNNQFVVKTTKDGIKDQEFDWVIYAKRNDRFARENPIVVEEEKGVKNKYKKGEYLHPEIYEKE